MPPVGWLWSPSRARQLLQCPALFFCHRRNIPAFCCLELCIQKAETYYMNIQTHHVDNQLHALLRMLPSTVLFCNSSIKSSVLPTQETKRNKRGTNSWQQKLCQTKSRQNRVQRAKIQIICPKPHRKQVLMPRTQIIFPYIYSLRN